ncbi:hypothetical protein DMC64_33915 [Amycolatopsis sp. WAC 04197]|uniref:hypothetical protein n=1 Tax=Amycolatopsis sp. WAC 04197 TaxID=2203199 RepID=UPI000F799037|nr:hypothetical protein [Amycolatopsis sp. WAC 04197]RSN40765.1 hypothetical protein DMC64_33915 [Amycolatopsis sp. WAC 04197]
MSDGLVDIQLPVVQNLINKTDDSIQQQLAAHRAHAARDLDALSTGLGGAVKQAGITGNMDRVDLFNNQVHPFAQQLVDTGNSVVKVSAGAAADATQAMIAKAINPSV